MGGDYGPEVVIPAAVSALANHPTLRIIAVGDEPRMRQCLARQKNVPLDRIELLHTDEEVTMADSPTMAMRTKKKSSMRLAINLVRDKKAQACVSAGNTGALMAISRFVLKTLPGIERPAICAKLPAIDSSATTLMLDLGANVDSTPEQLCQLAIMGTVLARCVENIPNPRVALLNIGSEEVKGNDQVKRTAQLLANEPGINYSGFVEGDQIFSGKASVILCDGFVGNVALKVSEGVVKIVIGHFQRAFKHNLLTRLMSYCVRPILRMAMNSIDPGRYNGASFLGLQGIVIKSHGSAKAYAFSQAIDQAILEVEQNIIERIEKGVADLLKLESTTRIESIE